MGTCFFVNQCLSLWKICTENMSKARETYNKKENETKKLKKKKEKAQRKEERKSNSNKGKGLESMLAYVDEHGQISSVPPDTTKQKKEIQQEDIQISVSKKDTSEDDKGVRTGQVIFFNASKGYGFIKDAQTGDSIFVHVNALQAEIRENDKVTFETEMGKKGLNAVRVKPLT